MSEEEENSGEENEEIEEEGEDNEDKEEEDNEDNEDNDKENEEEEGEGEEKEEEETPQKDKKVVNKFLESKLHQSTEIKIDLKGSSNSSGIFGNNINNYSNLTATFPIRSSLQILTDINNDMDLLSSKINREIMPKYKINSYSYKPENIPSYFSPTINNYYNSG